MYSTTVRSSLVIISLLFACSTVSHAQEYPAMFISGSTGIGGRDAGGDAPMELYGGLGVDALFARNWRLAASTRGWFVPMVCTPGLDVTVIDQCKQSGFSADLALHTIRHVGRNGPGVFVGAGLGGHSDGKMAWAAHILGGFDSVDVERTTSFWGALRYDHVFRNSGETIVALVCGMRLKL